MEKTTRQPSKAKKSLRYDVITNNASTRAGKPGEDYGSDNFTYDPEKISKWNTPEHFNLKFLPKDLHGAFKDWMLAGAAVDTALDRVQELSSQAAQRAFPACTREDLLALRRPSDQCSSTTAVDELSLVQSNASTIPSTPATSFSIQSDCVAPPPKLETNFTKSGKEYAPHPNQLPDSITSKPGMESPPFTPITHSGSESGSGARSPEVVLSGPKEAAVMPDPSKLSAQLSPLMSPSSDAPEVKANLVSWMNYSAAFDAELFYLRRTALPRLQGHTHTVQKLLFELHANPPGKLAWETAEAILAFAQWWNMAKGQVQDREVMVAALATPNLEDVVAGA